MPGKNLWKTVLLMLVFFVCMTGYSPAQTVFGPRTGQLLKTFTSGTFHMKAVISGGGQNTEIETFVKGDMSAVTMSGGGQKTRIIARDNKVYMIDESKKTITILASTGRSNDSGMFDENMKYTGSGTAMFGGRMLPYEEYVTADEDDDGYGDDADDEEDNDNNGNSDNNKVQYFIDGNRIAGNRSITPFGNIDTVISVLDQNIPANVFNVPTTGYQIQDMSKGF